LSGTKPFNHHTDVKFYNAVKTVSRRNLVALASPIALLSAHQLCFHYR